MFITDLQKYGSANSSLLQHAFHASCDSHASQAVADDVKAFIDALPGDIPKTMGRPKAQAIESITNNAALLKRNDAVVGDWLKAHGF